METYYKKDLKCSYLILEGNDKDQEDYQIAMLKENKIPGILETHVRYMDDQSHYYYDISGKTSLASLCEKSHLGVEDMKKLVYGLMDTIEVLQKYMLDGNCLLLEPEYIFYEGEKVFFCYYPPYGKEAKEEFHELTEFFVREVNYKDEEGVRFAYTLHKATMEENYSIARIMEEVFSTEEEETEESEVVDYTRQMETQSFEDILVAEKIDFWEPVKRLLEKKWRQLRGDREEEE